MRRPPAAVLAVLAAALGLVAAACAGEGTGPDLARGTTTTTSPAAPPTTAPDAEEPPPPPVTEPPPLPPPRVRLPRPFTGVWVHLFDDSLKTPAGLEQVLDDAAAAGLDAVFVQVARRHDAYYTSQHLPPTSDPGLAPGFDVLAAAVEGGRARGLQIHAWFNVATAWHHTYANLELPPGHVTREHGPGSADPWMTVSHDGTQSREYFDIGLLELHDHVAAVVTDIARYEVDGVHLDYLRYDGAEWGYHPRALQRFAAETGFEGVPGPNDPTWSAWRRAQGRAIVARAQAALAAARPEALLSAAVIALGDGPAATGGFAGTRAYRDLQQDWAGWVAGGLIDLVVLMAYQREAVPAQAKAFRDWVAYAAELDGAHADAHVAVGVGAWLNAVPAGLAQAREALAHTAGAVLFSYQQDSADAPRGALLQALRHG